MCVSVAIVVVVVAAAAAIVDREISKWQEKLFLSANFVE